MATRLWDRLRLIMLLHQIAMLLSKENLLGHVCSLANLLTATFMSVCSVRSYSFVPTLHDPQQNICAEFMKGFFFFVHDVRREV